MARITGFATGARVGGGITVIGADALIAKFRAIASTAALETGHLTYATAQEIQGRAKNLVPHETGNLASGIHIMKLGPYTWGVSASSLEGNIEPKNQKEYAPFVEYGTRKMSARPFMRPAFASGIAVANLQLKILAKRLERML